MSMARVLALLIAATFGMAGLLRCTGIETTNGVTLTVSATSIDGTVPPRASVVLYDTGYIPVINRGVSRSVTAGESGIVAFRDLPLGRYNAVVTSPDRRTAAFIPDIVIAVSEVDSRYRGTLEPTGSVNGAVTGVPDTVPEVIAYLQGTGFYALLPGDAAFTMDQIPAGEYMLLAVERSWSNTVDRNPKIQTKIAVSVGPAGGADAGTIIFAP